MGPRLTTTAPEAAPGGLFAVTPLRWSPNNYPAIFAASFVGGVIQTSIFGKQASSMSAGCDLHARLFRGSALRSSRFFQLRKRVQPCAGGEPLQCHLDIKGSLLKRPRCIRPIHASASEGVELCDRRRCQEFASWECVFMTYVIQLDDAHVLPFRLPTSRRFCIRRYGPPYFAIVARTTAQLKMKPVIIMNLDTS